MKTVFISEESLAKLREKLVTKSKKDGLGDKSSCDGVIGSDGGANGFFHVSGNKSRLVESFNQFNMDDVDSISYSVECNVDDEYNWSDDYNSLDEYLADVEEYDGEVYDNDGHQLAFFSFSRHQLPDAFGEDIANMMINRDGDERYGELWIEDISMIGTSGVDLDDVDAVNAVAKRISKPNGESHFLLTDGSVVSFHDHAQIQSIDGMTVSKFLELGNIRFGGGNVLSIELIKEPTVQQKLRLKRMLSYADEVYLDIAKPNKYDNMYPEVIIGVNYSSVNPDRIINDILNYFEDGIRPLGEMKVGYKSVIEEAAKKVVPPDLLKIAIKERPSWRERWAIICSNGVIEFYEKKTAPKAKNSLFWYRQWFGNNNVYFVDLDKVQLTENIESEVEASEINLSSFKKREELAPKIWYGRKLNSKVRLKLLDIADDFWDFANINWVDRDGIYLTGSICGKNWSKYSDIDLHISVDFSKVDERTDFVQEYFDLKKNEWNNNHKNLKIYGFPVELYVEDINADTKTSSKYDLEKNDWVKESDEDISIGLNKYSIKAKSANIMTKIDDLQDECDSTDDDAKLRDIGKRAKKLYRKIKRMRKFGLNRSGEGDSLNIIYKVLRRSGYLEKLWDLSSTLYDKVNSLNEAEKKHKQIIAESQESKSIAAAKKLVMQRLNYSEQEADEFIRIKLRNDLPVLRTPQGGKFILGVTRMFCDGELRTANDIGNLNSTLKLVASDAHINEYDRNLNNLSCQELIQRFAKAMSDNLEAERDEVNQMVFDSPSDYEIVRIDSFEEAEEYGDYVSWCVTHDERMFDSYTNDGINQFYFCLKNGFENVAAQPSEGCPLDEYGLSMIAVSVNENGMLNTCTCRWNHDNGGDDSIMNTKEISQVIDMNFFEVFKPNNKWKYLLDSVTQRLENGEDTGDVFDKVYPFAEGFAVVKLNGKWNLIDQEGRFLSSQWFDYISYFSEGFARAELNNRCNFINQEGRLLSNQWFDNVYPFAEGFAEVKLNGKWNYINQEGKILSNQWFDYVTSFESIGFAEARLNGKWFRIDTNGNLTLIESADAKEPINEYLDRDYNAPLYKYFKWAEKASDDELAKDLVYGHPYLAKRYIENSSDIEEFEGALEKYTDDDWYDEDVIDWFVDVLRKHNLCEIFIEYCRNRLAYFEWPSWMVMSFVRVVKNEWCIHFGEDSYSIARNGFKYGTGDVEQLAYTSRSANGHAGYNFAFPANYNRINTDYGEEAVLFQTSGVEIYHEGDCEHQVVFWGPYAKNFIPIKQVYGEWYVYGNKGQILYKSEDIDDIIRWAMNNKEQYRKQIMVGHG